MTKKRGKKGASYFAYRHETADALDVLLSAVFFDPVSGRFYSRENPEVLKCRSNGRYRILTAAGIEVQAHRAAWAFVEGKWPEAGMHIDHVNGDGEDNRPSNLRPLLPWLNQARSVRPMIRSRGGFFVLSVRLSAAGLRGRWLFSSEEDAAAARREVIEIACRKNSLTAEELETWMGSASAASLVRASTALVRAPGGSGGL